MTLSLIYVFMPMYAPFKFFREMLAPPLLRDSAARVQELLSFLLALLGPVFSIVAVSHDVDDEL
jgi:hypothetical protein